jgi:hypothetical protein
MSPQGRKRVAGMVSRDYQTVSGIGGTQTYPHQVRSHEQDEEAVLVMRESLAASWSDHREHLMSFELPR